MAIVKYPFKEAFDAMKGVGNLIPGYLDSQYGLSAKIDYTELTGEPQKFSVEPEAQFLVPEGTMIESHWRQNLAHNFNVVLGKELFRIFGIPWIRAGFNLLAAAGEVVTLGLVYKAEDMKPSIDEGVKELCDELMFRYFDTRKRYLIYGIPEDIPGTPHPFPPKKAQTKGSSYPRFRGNQIERPFSYNVDEQFDEFEVGSGLYPKTIKVGRN
jgi:hypothetical protein